MISLLVPRVPTADQIYPYLLEIDSSRVYSNNGPLNQRLVRRLSEYLEVDESKITTLSNATLALEGALFTSPTSSQNWDMPSWTFTATPAAALNADKRVRFLDVDDEWRVVPDSMTKNLVDVLPFGSPLNLGRLQNFNLDCILIDGAASFDALRAIDFSTSTPIGVVVSMHATKTFSAGEGGIFISNDSNWVAEVKQWSNFGMSGTRTSEVRGTNAKLSEYAAAVALATLDIWPQIHSEYSYLSEQIRAICGRLGLDCFSPMSNFVTPYWILRDLSPEIKQKIMVEFSKHHISFRDWWESGTAEMPAYVNLEKSSLDHSQKSARTSLGLPFHTSLSDSDLFHIESTLKRVLAS